MEEPSVLDYIKSRFKWWGKEKIDIPAESSALEPGNHIENDSKQRKIPWRSILGLLLVLAGQRSFEPPNRDLFMGICFYLSGLVLVIWAIIQNEWVTAPIPEQETHKDPNSIRSTYLIPAVFLALSAFLLFGGNQFNLSNIILWVLSIGCLFMAFWLKENETKPVWPQVKDFIKKGSWQFQLSRWQLLVILVIVLVAFFRIFQLSEVPAEPFSDHAEKILDVYDVSQGQTSIFFPRNTGREAFQMYLTLFVAKFFGTGLSFISLKIGTALCGLLTLPYVFLLGKEIANRRVGLIAVLLAGIAYWPNVISRVGLRFPLYPLFVAPVLFYLIRGLQRSRRNDFILAGLFLGLGLHGYSPFRIMPFLVVFVIGLYIIHRQPTGKKRQVVIWLVLLAITSLFVFLPLLRYWLQNPDAYSSRAFSRLGSIEQPLPGVWWQIFLSNMWNGLKMFNWSDGEIWVHSIPYRPALDMVSAALFLLGVVLIFSRYLRQRNWVDVFLLTSVPFLLLPSVLSLAFPSENPSLNRTGGAIIPVFIICALALEGFLQSVQARMDRISGKVLTLSVATLLFVVSISQNYDLVFNQYNQQFRLSSWNSSEMGLVIKQFGTVYRSMDNAWIIPYPYWVDTRLPGVWAGIPNRDFAVWPEDLANTLNNTGAKLFIYNTADTDSGSLLKGLYPQGSVSQYASKTPNHDFMIYFVPAQ